ncbi:hypothetical protein GCM10028805_23830 [Spirosoma harenae]
MRYKLFISLFLSTQACMMSKLVPERPMHNSYYIEVVMQIIFSISKVNHLYNFFTDPGKSGNYSYTTNNIYAFKGQPEKIEGEFISKNGTIKHLVCPLNYPRLNQIQSIASNDTTLYNAVVRSEALFFLKKYKSYPILYVEVLNHRLKAKIAYNKFLKTVETDTIYSNYFSMN